MGKHYVINQPRRPLDDATRGNVKLVVVKLVVVASVARARREELTAKPERTKRRARVTRGMAKKTAKERMVKGRDELVNMGTVSKATTLVRFKRRARASNRIP